MPSPVGHSLAGLVIAGFGAGDSRRPRQEGGQWRALLTSLGLMAALVFAANAPDLDFLPGILRGDPDRFHHGPAHSLGAAVVFALAAAFGARIARARRPLQFGLLMGLAFSSHLLLDMFSLDKRPPSGVPLLWPLTAHYYSIGYPLFLDIQRQPAEPNFVKSVLLAHNAHAMFWEFVIMGLVLAVSRLGHYAWYAFGADSRARRRMDAGAPEIRGRST